MQDELPGMIHEERQHLSIPKPNRGSRMGSISKISQAQILESHSNLSPVADEVERTASTRCMADHPVPLYSFIGVPMLSFVACTAIYLTLHPSSGLNSFTGATLLLYGTLAALSVFLMGSALRRLLCHALSFKYI